MKRRSLLCVGLGLLVVAGVFFYAAHQLRSGASIRNISMFTGMNLLADVSPPSSSSPSCYAYTPTTDVTGGSSCHQTAYPACEEECECATCSPGDTSGSCMASDDMVFCCISGRLTLAAMLRDAKAAGNSALVADIELAIGARDSTIYSAYPGAKEYYETFGAGGSATDFGTITGSDTYGSISYSLCSVMECGSCKGTWQPNYLLYKAAQSSLAANSSSAPNSSSKNSSSKSSAKSSSAPVLQYCCSSGSCTQFQNGVTCDSGTLSNSPSCAATPCATSSSSAKSSSAPSTSSAKSSSAKSSSAPSTSSAKSSSAKSSSAPSTSSAKSSSAPSTSSATTSSAASTSHSTSTHSSSSVAKGYCCPKETDGDAAVCQLIPLDDCGETDPFYLLNSPYTPAQEAAAATACYNDCQVTSSSASSHSNSHSSSSEKLVSCCVPTSGDPVCAVVSEDDCKQHRDNPALDHPPHGLVTDPIDAVTCSQTCGYPPEESSSSADSSYSSSHSSHSSSDSSDSSESSSSSRRKIGIVGVEVNSMGLALVCDRQSADSVGISCGEKEQVTEDMLNTPYISLHGDDYDSCRASCGACGVDGDGDGDLKDAGEECDNGIANNTDAAWAAQLEALPWLECSDGKIEKKSGEFPYADLSKGKSECLTTCKYSACYKAVTQAGLPESSLETQKQFTTCYNIPGSGPSSAGGCTESSGSLDCMKEQGGFLKWRDMAVGIGAECTVPTAPSTPTSPGDAGGSPGNSPGNAAGANTSTSP